MCSGKDFDHLRDSTSIVTWYYEYYEYVKIYEYSTPTRAAAPTLNLGTLIRGYLIKKNLLECTNTPVSRSSRISYPGYDAHSTTSVDNRN